MVLSTARGPGAQWRAVLAWARCGWGVAPSLIETKRVDTETGVHCRLSSSRCVSVVESAVLWFFSIASMLRKLLVFKDAIPVQFCFMLTCCVWYFYSLRSPLGVDLKCDVGKVHRAGSWLCCQLLIVALATEALRLQANYEICLCLCFLIAESRDNSRLILSEMRKCT